MRLWPRGRVATWADAVALISSNVPHGFTNAGTGELRLMAIHGASRFATEWLAGDDPMDV